MKNPWLICLFVTVSMIFQFPIISVGWSRFWDGWPWFWVVWPFLLVIVLLAIEVLWPDGKAEVFPGCATDQAVVLRKGEGKPDKETRRQGDKEPPQ